MEHRQSHSSSAGEGVLCAETRPGAYHDSIVLLQLQAGLAALSGIRSAGAVMGAAENLDLLREQGLLAPTLEGSQPDDLVIVVRAENEDAGRAALSKLDELLRTRNAEHGASSGELPPRSLSAAVLRRPRAKWVVVSVPGRYAKGVAQEALEHGRHVFLFSDNVAVADECELKKLAASKGLLVLGPDCGTAVIGGAGLGFANRLQPGPVALVGASGTGLQAVSTLLDHARVGVGAVIGTGGHDLSAEVGAVTTLQALDLLARDPECRVIVLVSKPPAPESARRVLAAARAAGKPTVLCLLGHPFPLRSLGHLHFAAGLSDAAELAVSLVGETREGGTTENESGNRATGGYLRGLFAGGTLALEGLLTLQPFLPELFSNLAMPGVRALSDPTRSEWHSILDLGDDFFTRGRPHPMIDQEARLRRLDEEAADPEVGVIVLDVVIGFGAHPDPAVELAPRIRMFLDQRDRAREEVGSLQPLVIIAILIGSAADPQDVDRQEELLKEAGARVVRDPAEAWALILDSVSAAAESENATPTASTPVALDALATPLEAINVGVETFADSLRAQGVEVLHVDWRPPAGGNEKMMSILGKLKATKEKTQ